MNEIKVPISPGELLDKVTILRIKSQRILEQARGDKPSPEAKTEELTETAEVA